jgi:hypothetical protein
VATCNPVRAVQVSISAMLVRHQGDAVKFKAGGPTVPFKETNKQETECYMPQLRLGTKTSGRLIAS